MDYQQYFARGFQQFVNNALAAQKLTPTALHRATGLSKSYVAKLCNTNNEPPQPSMANAHLICMALGFDLAKVIFALTKQLPEPDKDLRIRKDEKPRVRAKAMSAPAVKYHESAPEPTAAEVFDLIDQVELKS